MNTAPGLERLTLQVSGMTCSACANRIEKNVQKMDGVASVFVNLVMETAYVRIDPSRVKVQDVADRIAQLGFRASMKEASAGPEEAVSLAGIYKRRFLFSLLFTLPLLWPMLHHFSWTSSLWVPDILHNAWMQLLLATPVQLICGWPFLEGACRSLRSGSANMDVLIALGTLSAYLYSHYLVFHPAGAAVSGHGHTPLYFEASATIITVVWFGKWLEARARLHVRQWMEGWTHLVPPSVRVLRPEGETWEDSARVANGDTAIVLAGETLPVDGVVFAGQGLVDEATLSGESRPQDKAAGDAVSAGTRLVRGRLEIRVERAGAQTSLGQMVRTLEETQTTKPKLQAKADRAAAWFVPGIIALSAATFLYWYVSGAPGAFGTALSHAIAVVVSACPCAIGMAAPLSVFLASRQAARLGILFRHGEALESLSQADTILFDKTGTVTEGIPVVVGIVAKDRPARELLRLAATAERDGEHPIAGAFVREAGKQGVRLGEAERMEELPGYGISAAVEGRELLIGSARLLQSRSIRCPQLREIAEWEQQGATVVHIAVGGRWAGAAGIRDALRPGIAGAVQRLNGQGLRLLLVTGDDRGTAGFIGRQSGFKDIRAGALPHKKLELVRKLQGEGRIVAFVGDGVNDSPAMAAAAVGISVSNAASAAKEAADVQILRDDARGIVDAIAISRRALGNIRQNLTLAFIYNAMVVPAAMAGQLEPWAAGSAMTLSSLTVVLNAMRMDYSLKRGRRRPADSPRRERGKAAFSAQP